MKSGNRRKMIENQLRALKKQQEKIARRVAALEAEQAKLPTDDEAPAPAPEPTPEPEPEPEVEQPALDETMEEPEVENEAS